MREERGHWYLLTGFVIGIVIGLVYAWLFAPQERQDTSPASLQMEFKDQYRAMIASAFVATGNLPRAEARLALLGDQDVIQVLAAQAQRTLGEGKSPLEAQALGLLAFALGEGGSELIPSPLPSSTPSQDQDTPSPTQASASQEPAVTTPISTSTATVESSSPEPTEQESLETNPVLSSATPLPTRTHVRPKVDPAIGAPGCWSSPVHEAASAFFS